MADLKQQPPRRFDEIPNEAAIATSSQQLTLGSSFVLSRRAPERERPLAELPSEKRQRERQQNERIEKLEGVLEEMEAEVVEDVVRHVIEGQMAQDHQTRQSRPKKRRPSKKTKTAAAKGSRRPRRKALPARHNALSTRKRTAALILRLGSRRTINLCRCPPSRNSSFICREPAFPCLPIVVHSSPVPTPPM